MDARRAAARLEEGWRDGGAGCGYRAPGSSAANLTL